VPWIIGDRQCRHRVANRRRRKTSSSGAASSRARPRSTPRISRRTGSIATHFVSGPLCEAAVQAPSPLPWRADWLFPARLALRAAVAAAQRAEGGDRRRSATHRAGDAHRMDGAPHRTGETGVVGLWLIVLRQARQIGDCRGKKSLRIAAIPSVIPKRGWHAPTHALTCGAPAARYPHA